MDDDLITMDDMTNEEIISLLDDAERLLPVAHGLEYLPLLPVSYTHLRAHET